MLKEFKEFAMKGNMLDLAIGLILGAAFGLVVASLVNDVIMPPIGLLLGHVDFANLYIPLKGQTEATLADAKKAGPVIAYGAFLNTIFNFLIVAFVAFLIVKQANRFKKPAPAVAAPETKECPQCTSTIPLRARRCPQCTAEIA